MKRVYFLTFALSFGLASCSNDIATDSGAIKAYPNPYNAGSGILTIEKIDGSVFSTTAVNEIIVYDFNLTEVYRATVPPDSTGRRLFWGGIDNTGAKVVAGMYYLKVIISSTTSVSNADSMYKLIVQ